MTKRYLSLDVLRGLTVAFMIIVNNPGSWSEIYPPLRHAAWDGCTPCDLVFPFFLFCVGASMAFAFAKYTSLTWGAAGKVFKRGALLYLTGLLLTAFPFYPETTGATLVFSGDAHGWSSFLDVSFWDKWLEWASGLRLLGVLPRIAMCYVVASLLVLWLRKPMRLLGAVAFLSALHVGLLVAFAGPEGAFSLEGNFARVVDLTVFGEEHIYGGFGLPFDPEGLLGVLTGSCTAILGYLVGMMIRSSAKRYEQNADVSDSSVGVCARLFTISAGALLFGLTLSLVVPINKALWSVSYVFYAAGWAMFVLALLMYLIDVNKWEKPFFPFKALGMNALALFVLSGLIMKIIWRYTDWDYTAVFGVSEGMSFLFSLMYLSVHLVIAAVLYRLKIFIKL
jgi:predicted acyltransferase